MTCKEVEQMIMPYINDELTDKQLGPFLEHINACKNCYEELEIYYTIYAGLSQLDGENEGGCGDGCSSTCTIWRPRCWPWRLLWQLL